MTDKASHFAVTESNGVNIVEFADRKILEDLYINEIESDLLKLVEGRSGIKLLLNFKNVDHLSSAALGTLITLDKKVNEQGGELRLSDIHPRIYEVFKITRLNKLFKIFDSSGQALDGF